MEFFDIAVFAVDKRDTLTMTEVYQEIGNVSILGAAEGTYEYGFALTHQYDQTLHSEYLDFSIDGGDNWYEFIGEPSDSTNKTPVSYGFFREGISGDLNLQVRARKEVVTGIMTIDFVDTYIRRVK